MTDKPTPTDAEIRGLAATGNGAYQDDETAIWEITDPSLLKFARAVLAKWGTPAGAGEPFGYFHQLLNHEGKGNGVWLGAAERKVVEQAHTPGETSEEIVALYATPQPTQAQAGAVPQYRLLHSGVDRIEDDDEFLSDDTTTWAIDPNGIFSGNIYGGHVLRPARRRIKGGQLHSHNPVTS